MQKKLVLPVLLAAALAALFLAACGGDSEEDKIVETVEAAAVSTDPAECKLYLTQAFMEQTEIETGKAAVESCEENAGEAADNPDSVSVDAVEIDGTNATAEVAFEGGNLNGQTLKVRLIEENGEWKLDWIDVFVDFDRDAFQASFEAGFAKSGLTPEQQECTRKGIEAATDGQLEQLVTSGKTIVAAELFGNC